MKHLIIERDLGPVVAITPHLLQPVQKSGSVYPPDLPLACTSSTSLPLSSVLQLPAQ